MAYIDSGTRVGRSQAVGIFWGLVSTFFAAAACYYFWKFHENETTANVLRDQSLNLQEQIETLSSQKDQLQASIGEQETQLKTREDFLQDKEAKLADEESRLEALGTKSDSDTALGRAQAAIIKRFNDAVHKLVKDPDTDVVVRGGRPVLRVPSSVFFDYGETALKPEGKSMLKQIALALDGQLDNFELRVEVFTDAGGESDTGTSDKTSTDKTGAGKPSLAPPPDNSTNASGKTAPPSPGWELTGKRAGVLARYIREQTAFPFQNVLVAARGDFSPIIDAGAENHSRNRRVEITLTPVPPTFHPIDTSTPDQPTAATKPEHHAKPAGQVALKFGDQAKTKKSSSPTDKKKDQDDDSSSFNSKKASARNSSDSPTEP